MADTNVVVRLSAKDDASRPIAQVKRSLLGLVSQQGVAGGMIGGLLTGGLVGLANNAIGAIGAIGGAISDLAVKASEVDKVNASFDDLATNAGQSSTSMLASMRAASSGMISDSELMLGANRAMLLGVADSAEEMNALMNVARSRGQAMGLSLNQAFSDLITGIGRGSVEILDNLGIVMDSKKVFDTYAQSLGTTAEKLDKAAKTQAILNEIMRQSASIKPVAPTGAGAATAQAAVAQENAGVEVGRFFAPAVRAFAQIQVDAIHLVQGTWNSLDFAIRQTGNTLADVKLPEETVNRMVAFTEAGQQARLMQEENVLGATQLVRILDEMSGRARIGELTEQDALYIRQVTNELAKMRDAQIAGAAAQDEAAAAAQRASPYYAQIVQREQEIAYAAWRASPAMQQMAQGLGTVGQLALQAATDLNTFNIAANRIGAGFAAADRIQGLRTSAISEAQSAADRAVNAGGDPTEVANMLGNITDKLWNMKGPADQTTESTFLFRQELDAAGNQLDTYATGLEDSNRAATKFAAGGLSDMEAKFDSLKSKVKSVIDDAMSLQVDWPGKGGDTSAGGDAINENAKRLAAIANEGLIGQPWLEEFKAEVPGAWADLKLLMAEGMSPQSAAQSMLGQFEAGDYMALLDKGMIKDQVKAMIMGDQGAAALAQEIAGELAGELGVSMPDALAAAQSALGVTPTTSADGKTTDATSQGNSAGATFQVGFLAGFSTNDVALKILAGIDKGFSDNLDAVKKSGKAVAAEWGNNFMSTVGANIPPALVAVLTTLVTPAVWAQIQANQGLTAPNP